MQKWAQCRRHVGLVASGSGAVTAAAALTGGSHGCARVCCLVNALRRCNESSFHFEIAQRGQTMQCSFDSHPQTATDTSDSGFGNRSSNDFIYGVYKWSARFPSGIVLCFSLCNRSHPIHNIYQNRNKCIVFGSKAHIHAKSVIVEHLEVHLHNNKLFGTLSGW